MSQLQTKAEIVDFLKEEGYAITENDGVLILEDEDGLNVFAAFDEAQMEFMVDLCGLDMLDATRREEIYEKILDQNTEILPSCFGVDSSDPDSKQLVLVDSLATENLDTNELLLALDSLAVNVVTAHDLLQPYLKPAGG